MKSYSTYLFDFDYTLADSSQGIVKCFQKVLIRHQYLNIENSTIKKTIGKTLEESFSILTGLTDEKTLNSYKEEYVREADQFMTANTFLFPETLNVLNGLKYKGAKIGIISTKYRYRIVEFLNQNLPKGFIDIIIGGEDVEKHKPSPEGLLKAISQLNEIPSQVLYIGDSIVDAETAKAAQVDFAGVLHGVTTREELAQYPNICIENDLNFLL